MKKIILTTLLICGLSTTLFAKEAPSLQETVDFINRVMSSDEASSEVTHTDGSTNKKPSFTVDGDCKLIITQNLHDGYKYEFTYHMDLKKHKFEYGKYEQKKGYFWIKDRREANTIKGVIHMVGKSHSSDTSSITESTNVYVNIKGKYQEKMEKALKHLSTMCVGELGKDDPF